MKGIVYIIGAGPGDPELITVKGKKIIKDSDLVIYTGSLVPKEVIRDTKAEVLDSSSMTREEINKKILDAVTKGKIVSRVHTGDPSIYGAIHEEITFFEEKGIDYKIIPGVTSAFALAAEAKISLTAPNVTQTVIFTRVGGRTQVPEKESLRSLASHNTTIAIYLSAPFASTIKKELVEGGFSANSWVYVGYKVSWKEQKIIKCRLYELDEVLKKQNIKKTALFLVVPDMKCASESKLYDKNFKHGLRK